MRRTLIVREGWVSLQGMAGAKARPTRALGSCARARRVGQHVQGVRVDGRMRACCGIFGFVHRMGAFDCTGGCGETVLAMSLEGRTS